MDISKLPESPPPIDKEYVEYIVHKFESGWISEQAAIMGMRARAPGLSVARARARLNAH